MKTRHIFIAVLTIAILVAFYTFVFSDKNSAKSNNALRKEIAEQTSLRDSLQQELQNRQETIRKLREDSIYIEKIARTKYGMTRKGEKVFQFE